MRRGALSPEPAMYNPLRVDQRNKVLKKKYSIGNPVPLNSTEFSVLNNRSIKDTASRFKNNINNNA